MVKIAFHKLLAIKVLETVRQYFKNFRNRYSLGHNNSSRFLAKANKPKQIIQNTEKRAR